MASYEQVVKLENEKPDGVIRLVESNGFYRAYNKSAFLFHRVIAQHKVTRKFAKNINQEIVYVGFPADRLLDRVGGRSHKKTEFGYDLELAAGEIPSMEEYEEWRKTVPTEPASRGGRRGGAAARRRGAPPRGVRADRHLADGDEVASRERRVPGGTQEGADGRDRARPSRGVGKMAIYLELPVYKTCYELYLTFVTLRRTLPREERYTIGEQLDRAMVDVLVLLYRINSTREKSPLIARARQLVNWQRSVSRQAKISDAVVSFPADGRPESGGSRSDGARHTANPMKQDDPTYSTEATT